MNTEKSKVAKTSKAVASISDLDALLGELNEVETPAEQIELTDLKADDQSLAAVVDSIEESASVAAKKPKAAKKVKAKQVEGESAPVVKKSKKSKSESVPTVETAETVSEVVAEKPTKERKVAAPRKVYANQIERLVDRFGDKIAQLSVLEVSDVDVEVATRVESLKDKVRKLNMKQQKRAVALLEGVASGGKFNTIASTAFSVLMRDGFISRGKSSNLMSELQKTHTLNSAYAMGNNTLAVMLSLRLLSQDGDKFVANPQSTLWAAIKSTWGVAAAA